MARLPKFTLAYDPLKENWKVENDATDRVVRRFDTKEEATVKGALKKAVGSDGGSVRIEKARRLPRGTHLPPQPRSPLIQGLNS